MSSRIEFPVKFAVVVLYVPFWVSEGPSVEGSPEPCFVGCEVHAGSSCRKGELWNHPAAPSALCKLENSLISCCHTRVWVGGSHREGSLGCAGPWCPHQGGSSVLMPCSGAEHLPWGQCTTSQSKALLALFKIRF